jgi:O-acetyl-ADP-ribose deacetylase (regulator of RNase III)
VPLKEYKGNLFNSRAQTLVNTVNCVGVMGKGVALEFRRRFPEMFDEYQRVCQRRALRPGQLMLYKASCPWILNMAVKDDWKQPSRIVWVRSCLEQFVASCSADGITSIAFPWIGAMNGGLPWPQVHGLMRRYLGSLRDIDIEIVEFDPGETDPLFERIRSAACSLPLTDFARAAGMPPRSAALVRSAIVEMGVPSLQRLEDSPGVGRTTVERLYSRFRADRQLVAAREPSLFGGD